MKEVLWFVQVTEDLILWDSRRPYILLFDGRFGLDYFLGRLYFLQSFDGLRPLQMTLFALLIL